MPARDVFFVCSFSWQRTVRRAFTALFQAETSARQLVAAGEECDCDDELDTPETQIEGVCTSWRVGIRMSLGTGYMGDIVGFDRRFVRKATVVNASEMKKS